MLFLCHSSSISSNSTVYITWIHSFGTVWSCDRWIIYEQYSVLTSKISMVKCMGESLIITHIRSRTSFDSSNILKYNLLIDYLINLCKPIE